MYVWLIVYAFASKKNVINPFPVCVPNFMRWQFDLGCYPSFPKAGRPRNPTRDHHKPQPPAPHPTRETAANNMRKRWFNGLNWYKLSDKSIEKPTKI